MKELATRFNFKDVEVKWCRVWEEQNVFHAQPQAQKKPYSIVIPPPNVTGILHMGHALNNTLQDIMARYRRMQGYETCWMPGTDHAGIATQNVVERRLAKEGKSRYDVGREELLRRLWDWKKQYGDTIIRQLKRLGSSCDWPRTRFTMDDGYSAAVKHVFVRLYKKGLIYQGQYIINWCPRCRTALSDEEAEHREQQGNLYHIRYPLKNAKTPTGNACLIVATTRPETMLGNTAVAVNPADERYKDLIGATIVLPILNREIKIIADEFVDPAFGTGAVKVTPAHDPNDFLMGKRHQLEFINIMHPDARLNEAAGEFDGMDRFEAREAVIDTLKGLKLLEKIEPHTHAVGHCYRCHTVIEPYISKQWFVKMQPLAEPALRAVLDGKITFYPDRWTKVYINWMENIRDWCISRQIWWGHRIPAWYCRNAQSTHAQCREPIVEENPPSQCPHCGSTELQQDDDVLDTWFSSWLWPFAVFGWPQTTPDLKYFYPTAALFTASEIIFFWVARMIMAGIEFMGDIPFSAVYIHGTVRDAKGLKMSKSLGNALDPLEIINEYGADALRFSLIINSGQDLFISREKFEVGRNFANKVWNASRLVLMNTTALHASDRAVVDLERDVDVSRMDLPSQWIVSRFYSTLEGVSRAIENYRFSEAEALVYEFFWGNFCDWYLEISKSQFNNPDVQRVVFSLLEQSIRMLHPFMPFVTEEIWEYLNTRDGILSLQKWPDAKASLINPTVETQMQTLLQIVTEIRNLKVQWNVKPMQDVDCRFAAGSPDKRQLLLANMEMLKSLLRLKDVSVESQLPPTRDAAMGVVDSIKFCLPLGSVIDIAKEKARMMQQIEEQQRVCQNISQRLQNADFLKKAPGDIVAKDQQRLDNLAVKIKELQEVIRNLS